MCICGISEKSEKFGCWICDEWFCSQACLDEHNSDNEEEHSEDVKGFDVKNKLYP